MRIDKFLTECGLGSRREVKLLLKEGRVKLNEELIKDPNKKIKIDNDLVKVDEKELFYSEFRYYILNKPQGVVTATKDNREKTVMDILPDWVIKKNLVPVGRLDKNTEGLLFFTNDGKLAHKLLSPKSHVDKTYFVRGKYEVEPHHIETLEAGVDIGGYITKPAKVNKINEKEIYLTINEGKFHQVKKMFEGVHNQVVYLQRVSFGNLELGDLKLGEVKEIKRGDIKD